LWWLWFPTFFGHQRDGQRVAESVPVPSDKVPSARLKVLGGRYLSHGKNAGTAEADHLERLQNRQQGRMAWRRRGAGRIAMEKAATEFEVPAMKLMAAIRR
jgi:hypothetical protein